MKKSPADFLEQAEKLLASDASAELEKLFGDGFMAIVDQAKAAVAESNRSVELVAESGLMGSQEYGVFRHNVRSLAFTLAMLAAVYRNSYPKRCAHVAPVLRMEKIKPLVASLDPGFITCYACAPGYVAWAEGKGRHDHADRCDVCDGEARVFQSMALVIPPGIQVFGNVCRSCSDFTPMARKEEAWNL